MSARQIVRVFDAKAPNKVVQEVQIPEVFLAPVRNDLVNTVFANLNKNRRQAYGVYQRNRNQGSDKCQSFICQCRLCQLYRQRRSGSLCSGCNCCLRIRLQSLQPA